MLPILLGLALATFLVFHLCRLPSLAWCGFSLLLSGLVFLFFRKPFKNLTLLLLIFCLGFSWNVYLGKNRLQFSLPKKWISKTVLLEGHIASIPKKSVRGIYFNFHVDHFNHYHKPFNARLSWYGHYPELRVGDRWKLFARLKPPHGLKNAGGFDYEWWLFSQNIRATGYVVSKLPNRLIKKSKWKYFITRIRQRLQDTIMQSVKNSAIASVLSALTVGSRSELNTQNWQVFQRTGTSHLIAISGLHIGLIASMIYFFVRRVTRLFPLLLLRMPAPLIASLFAIFGTVFYSLLAGLSLPTERAMIMILALLLGDLLFRTTPLWKRLSAAFIIVVIIHPFSLFSASFWLSFSAVGALLYCFGGRLTTPSGMKLWIKTQIIIFIALFPFTLFFFQQVSLVMLIANLFAIPWIGFLIVPLCLVASCLWFINAKIGMFLFFLLGKLFLPMWLFLRWLSEFSFSYWSHALSNRYVLLSALMASAILLVPKGWPGRWLGMIYALPIFFFKPQAPQLNESWITLLDVGQGLAIVVRTAHHTLLYDAGPSMGGFDAGQSVVLPYLKHHGLSKIDMLMISHADNDHLGGANSLIKAFPGIRVFASVPHKLKSIYPHACYKGQHWRWDGVDFSVLYPLKNQPYQGNNSSCVVRVSNQKHSVLLTGDIEKSGERQLLKEESRNLSATIMIAPHHGSKTSSTRAFIQAVNPKYVLFPTGYYNRFGLPADCVLKRYQKSARLIYNTATDGEISVRLLADGQVRLTTSRERCYYWQQ